MIATPGAQQRSPSRLTPWIITVSAALVGLGVLAAMLMRGADQGPRANGNSAAVVNTPTNASGGGNTNASANVNSAVPAGWVTYDSSASRMLIFQRLDPAFTISYPAGWHVSEELGGVFLTESSWTGAEPSISVARLQEVFETDVIQECEDHVAANTSFTGLIYDTARVLNVSGRDSAYLSYHLPSDQYPDDQGRSDQLYVCVPHETGTDLIVGRPRTAPLVAQYFDNVLSTFSLKR